MSVDDGETQLVDGPLTRSIIGAFYEVYNILGFGFLESVYVAAMDRELAARGHSVGREVAARIRYKGDEIARHRIDILVDNRVIVETKAGEHLSPNARLQLNNDLKATGLEAGLLLHFGPKPLFWRIYSPTGRADPFDSSDKRDGGR